MTNIKMSPEKAAINGGPNAGVSPESELEIEELPKAIVSQIVKDKLSELSPDFELPIQPEAVTCFSETSRIFIQYLSATANDVCKEAKRQIVNPEDVFKALEDMEFSEFVGPLRVSLQEVRKNNAVKRSGSVKGNKSKDKGKRS